MAHYDKTFYKAVAEVPEVVSHRTTDDAAVVDDRIEAAA